MSKFVELFFSIFIDICNIISEMRKYMPVNVRYSMSKPTKEMINEIIKNIEEIACNV